MDNLLAAVKEVVMVAGMAGVVMAAAMAGEMVADSEAAREEVMGRPRPPGSRMGESTQHRNRSEN